MPKPSIPGKKHQRCGALTRHRHGFCILRPVPGKRRCRFHGGRSTGPRTPEGKASSAAARTAGLERWREEMRAKIAAGQATKFPSGRKPARNGSPSGCGSARYWPSSRSFAAGWPLPLGLFVKVGAVARGWRVSNSCSSSVSVIDEIRCRRTR